MAKTQVLTYYIHLQDAALVARLNAQIATGVADAETGDLLSFPTGGYGIYMAPVAASGTVDTPGGIGGATDGAANYFAALQGTYDSDGPLPVVEVGEARPPVGSPGYITSEWFVPGNGLPVQTRTFTKSTGWWIFGESTKFYWMGIIIYDPPGASFPPSDSEDEPIEQENLRVGFQTRFVLRGMEDHPSQNATIQREGKAFSRTGDGIGHRYAATGTQVREQINTSQIDPALTTPRTMWHRFYARPIRFGSIRFWRAQVASATGIGYEVGMDASGGWNFWLGIGSNSWSLHSTFGQGVLNEWAKFDVVTWCNHSGNVMHADVFLNGVKVVDDAQNLPGGVEANRYWITLEFGTNDIVASTAIIDLDDWMIANPPKTRDFSTPAWTAGAYTTGQVVRYQGTKTYYCLQNTSQLPGTEDPDGSGIYPYWRKLSDPVDFASGSHLVRVPAKAFGPNHASWPGDVRLSWGRPLISNVETVAVAVANAPYEVELDMADVADLVPNTQGFVALRLHIGSFKGGAPSGTIGCRIGAVAETMLTFAEQLGSLFWNSRHFTIASSNVNPLTGTQVWLRYNKSNDGNTSRVAALYATVECIGVFGTCDEPVQYDGTTQPQVFLPTNTAQTAEYPLSPYARTELPFAPIIVEGGTYVGNNLGQDLSFSLPPCFVMVRPLTGISGHVFWWSGMLGAHFQVNQGFGGGNTFHGYKQNLDFLAGSPSTADQQQEYLVRIAGASTQVNATGVTYQYVAWMDPAARFSRVTQVGLSTNSGLPRVEALDDPEFTPQHALILSEQQTTSTTNGMFQKSAGNAADGIHPTQGGAELANALTFGAGQLTWRAGLVTDAFANYSAVCLRRSDGNASPNEAKAHFFGTYTGDGTASRTINLAPATGLRPLYLLVQGNVMYHRDPSDLTNSSRTYSGGTSTTAITAGGTDSFTIGLTLNSNAVVYHYWGLWGGATAGNGGWSQNGEFVQVEADSRFPSDWIEPVVVEPVEVPVPGITLTDEPDLEDDTPVLDDTISVGGLLGGQVCEVYTRRLVNRALGRIGITKVIDNLATDQTEYATVARQHVKEDINAVLRDHPWAFATRYATLVLSSGSEAVPFSNDWVYAYVAPNRMMFARRMATKPPGRAYDYTPIQYRHYMSETLGPLILCNAATSDDLPLVLEYTIRITCPAFFGDAIFRDALVWRFAKSLASSLARDSNKAQYCETMYRDLLTRASTVVEREQQQDKHGDADWIDARG